MPQQPGLFDPDGLSTPHRTSALKAVGAVIAVAVVPLALVVGHLPEQQAGTTATPAADPATPNFARDWVAIETGSTSKVTLGGPDVGTAPALQSLAPAANCGVSLGNSPQLITLRGSTSGSPDPGLASYLTGSIGVKEKKSGTSCYQVNAVTTESLEVGLGSGVRTALGPDAVASSAYLDIELKGSARVLATARLGTRVVGTFEVQSGSSIGQPSMADHAPFVCTSSSDSGPDSGVNDNCRWPISAPSWVGTRVDDGIYFDTLTLKAIVGSFSLEGGADGTVQPAAQVGPAKASILELVANTVGCGGRTDTAPGAGQTPEVTIYRLGNVGTTTCAPTPYTLNSGDRFAQFLKPLATETNAQFVWEVTGRLPHTSANTVLPDITINYETPNAAGVSPEVTLGWCPDSSYQVTAPFYAGYSIPQVDALPDQDNTGTGETPNGKQYACVISRAVDAANGDPDFLNYRNLVYVYGDARMQF